MKTSPEKRAAVAKWAKANPDKVRANNRKHYEAHKEERLAYNKQWRLEHEGHNVAYNKKWTAEHRAEALLRMARKRVKQDGVECNIDLSDIVIPEFCPVLGIKIDCSAPSRADNIPSLDRIDPAKGYVKGNVWVISWKANHLKTNNTLETLHALTRALERLY